MKRIQNIIDYILEHKPLKISIIVIAAIVAIAYVILAAPKDNMSGYYAANKLYYEEKYEEAKLAYEALLGHAGTPQRIIQCIEKCDETMRAIDMFNNGSYSEAKKIFESLLPLVSNNTNLKHWIERCDKALKRN